MTTSSSHARSPDSAAPALAQRPEATTVSIEDLLAWVAAGRVRIPWFQRRIKWGADDIKLLFDSIYRGYPIGTLLLWKRPAEAEIVTIGPVRLDVPHRQDALWVVDGQQRVSALVGVLTSDYDDVSSDYALYFDLAAETFERASKRRAPEATWIPLHCVVDSEKLLAWLLERPVLSHLRAAAIRLGKRVREYQVPAYIVETDDEEPLRQIFHRTNRGGKPLEEAEVFEALHGARREDEPSGLPVIAGNLERTGFGRIEVKYVYMALLALLGKEPGNSSRLRLGDAEAREALPRTERALMRTIVFLQTSAKIPHVALLPYKRPLVVLGRFFDLHPEPHPRSLVLLSRWLWRGALTEQHQGTTVTTRKALHAIDEDEFRSIDLLLREVGHERPSSVDLSHYNFRHARSKLQTLALLALEPRHLDSGKPVTLDMLMASETPAHPIRTRDSREERLHGLASYLLHPPLEGGLRRALARQDDREILDSHRVDSEAHAALCAGDHGRFLALREASLREHVTRFLDARAQWQASDRPPLSALRIED